MFVGILWYLMVFASVSVLEIAAHGGEYGKADAFGE